jgi:Subtilase family
MMPLLLRIACIAVLATTAFGSITGLIFLLKPSASVQIRKFDVISGSDSSKPEGALASRMLAVRIQQIDAILTTSLTGESPAPEIKIDSVISRELRLAPETSNRIDVEFKAFDFDIAGILNSILETLHRGPAISGVIIHSERAIEVLANYRQAEVDVLGPWGITSTTGLSDAFDLLAHRIVFDYHTQGTRRFGSMTTEQFRLLVASLKHYQQYVHEIADNKILNQQPNTNYHLMQSEAGFKKLADEEVESSAVYSYLGSIATIVNDEESAENYFTKALALDSTDRFSQQGLASALLAGQLTQTPQATKGDLSTITKQEAFQALHVPESGLFAGNGKILVALIANGVAPISGIRLAAEEDLTPGSDRPSPDEEEHSYGTQLASVIAAIAPDAEILSIKAFDSGAISTYSVVRGIDLAIERKARILVLPFGIGIPDQAMKDVVQEAITAGLLVVAPAGNTSNEDKTFPAAFANVLSVAALQSDGRLAPFSTFGKWIKAAAPGIGILTLDRAGGIQKQSGTSVACAEAAGIAALVWSAKPQLNANAVTTFLTSSASKPKDERLPIGSLNAELATRAAQGT